MRQRGFTLIELMITVALLAIMLGLGVPALRTFISNQKVKTASYELTTSIVLARSEAIKRNTAITLTPGSSSSWASGWTVKVGTTTLQEQQSMTDVTITPQSAAGTAATLSSLTFAATGRPNTPTGFSNGRVWFEVTGSGSTVRCVTLDLTGIPTSKTGNC